MLKILKLMVVGVLWFGVCVQAKEVDHNFNSSAKVIAQYTVRGFKRDDIRFVKDAYNTYLDSMKSPQVDKQQVAIDYCNTLLSRFDRSQLVAMAKAASSDLKKLKEAIRVACEEIDKIGAQSKAKPTPRAHAPMVTNMSW